MHAKENEQKQNKATKKKKWSWRDWLIGLILIIGLGILLYPSFSNWVNSYTASTVVADYSQKVEQMDDSEKLAVLEEARLYNQKLLECGLEPGILSKEDQEEYLKLFGGADQAVIGSLEIPTIKVNLPIYKGTSEDVLTVGVGHLEGSSVPVGGAGTHAVLSGHRGLPSMKLLSDLDQVSEDDIFIIRTTGETLTYQVDAIHVVNPEDIHFLTKDAGKDQVTLVTCTPYGVNTHRLLVTGHRVSNELDLSKTNPDAKQVNRLSVALWIGIPLMLVIVIGWMLFSRKRNSSDLDDEIGEDL